MAGFRGFNRIHFAFGWNPFQKSAVLPASLPSVLFKGVTTYGWPWFLHGLIDKMKHVMGVKTEEQSKFAAKRYARIVQKLGFPVQFKDFKIQNIVSSCDANFPIRLKALQYSSGRHSSVILKYSRV